MPTNCKPFEPNSLCAKTNSGISSRQGTHQVAQKLTTTTFPRHCPSDCAWPDGSGKDKPSSALASCASARRKANHAPAPIIAMTSAPRIIQERKLNFSVGNLWVEGVCLLPGAQLNQDFRFGTPLSGITVPAGSKTVTSWTF